MATAPLSSITPPAPPSDSSTPTVPPPSTQPNTTSDTPPPSSPSTPATSSPPPSQSPPPPDLPSPPPSPPLTPPPVSPPPVATSSPPPSPPSPPPISATSSPPPTSATSSPPPPSKSSQPTPTESSPPPQPSPITTYPPPPLEISSSPPPFDFAPPPPEDTPATPPPEKTPTTPPSPPDPLSPITFPSPPSATSSPPSPPIPLSPTTTPSPLTNSSASGSLAPLASLPTEKPNARTTTPGSSGAVTAMSPPKGGGMKPSTAAAVGVVVVFLALSLVVMAVWFTRRRKRQDGSGGYVMPSPFASSQNSDSSFTRPQNSPRLAANGSGSNLMYSSDPNSKSWFTYEELSDATQGFSAQKLLGEGGFGCVYKGLLVDGREVAVKQLKIGGGQGEREFRAEVEIISRVHHRYLVSLVGYCISDHQRLLVYEYLPNDTLHYHLHGEGRPVMEWSTRVKVAVGAARGIAYLHEDCQPRIIHRDIKSSNILLDNNFEARVADFGLAKLAADANTHVTTRVMGTFGYMAPEYASSGKLTEKSDVYSYGVVLLELITGRKPVDVSQPLGDESLVEWARPLLNKALENEKFEDLIDPRLGHNYVELEMFRMIEAAGACIRHLAPKRPRMSQVVRVFDSMKEHTDLTNGMKPGQSEIHNSREQSAQIKMFQRLAFPSQDLSSEYLDRSHSSWNSSKL